MAKFPKLTEAEFDELKRRRDAMLDTTIRAASRKLFGTDENVSAHINYGGGSGDCYCGCPDGPCQHDWSGPWRDLESGHGGERTCSRCGMGAMQHSLHTMDF